MEASGENWFSFFPLDKDEMRMATEAYTVSSFSPESSRLMVGEPQGGHL